MDWLWELLEYLGEALVFLGVVGEVLAERKLISKNNEAGRDAIEGMASGVLIVGLGVSLGALLMTNEHFNARIADLNLKAAQANERAAGDARDRVELENRIADIFGPRRLTLAQSASIVSKLKGLNGVKIDVYVVEPGNAFTSSEDSVNLGRDVLRTLRAAHMDAEGWILESCTGVQVSSISVIATGKGSKNRRIASRVLDAFRTELEMYSKIGDVNPVCMRFSDLDPTNPNRHGHDAAISITIGRKVQPILTHEMLEPTGEQESTPAAKP